MAEANGRRVLISEQRENLLQELGNFRFRISQMEEALRGYDPVDMENISEDATETAEFLLAYAERLGKIARGEIKL